MKERVATGAVPLAPPSAPAPSEAASAPAPAPPVDAPRPPETTRRGLLWASNVSILVAALGALLLILAYRWADVNRPARFEPLGLSGTSVGWLLVGFGVAAAFLFQFPARREVPEPARTPTAWEARAAQFHVEEFKNRALTVVGAAVFLVGLLLVVLVQRGAQAAEPRGSTFIMAGIEAPFGTWMSIFGGVALVGLVLWTASGLRLSPLRQARLACQAAARFELRRFEGLPVDLEELQALMRRLDRLLAQLPPEEVERFSQSADGRTYLRVLGRA